MPATRVKPNFRKYCTPITIECNRNCNDQNRLGQRESKWEELGRTRAYIRPTRGREVEFGHRLEVRCNTVIEIPWFPGVNERCRVLVRSRDGVEIFYIGHVDNLERANKVIRLTVASEGIK